MRLAATDVRLRQVDAASPMDRAFLRRVYANTRADEMALVPWSDEQKAAFIDHQFAAQDHHYRTHYPGASFDIIEDATGGVGRLYVHRSTSEIRIMDLALLPGARGRGIGTSLLTWLVAQSTATGQKLSIHVERENRAQALYRRLGFHVVADRGAYLLMERPVSNQNQENTAS